MIEIDKLLKEQYTLIHEFYNILIRDKIGDQGLHEKIDKAWKQGNHALTIRELESAEKELNLTIREISGLFEQDNSSVNYNILRPLITEYDEILNRIDLERHYYNLIVNDYNIIIQKFPNYLISKLFGFKKRDFFKLDFPFHHEKKLPTTVE